MTTLAREQKIWWILRVATAMCFIGHGIFGLITKEEWVPFFGVAGMARDTALALMPFIGTLDIALGVFVLLRPTRALLLYMTAWALWTAALRPLSGDSFLEFLERAGNYGVPLAFLIFLGPVRTFRDWISRAVVPSLAPEREAFVWRVLAATTALLLIGHGGLAMQQKAALVNHADILGLGGESLVLVGAIEIALAVVVLLAPRPALLVGIALWKIATELLYPIGGAPVWEFVERAGSYAAPLALAILATARIAALRVRVTPRVAGLGPAAAVIVLATSMPTLAQAQEREQDRIPIAPEGIIDSLRRGGYVLACRHAATNHDQSDRGRVRELQRNLSAEGEEQAKSIGAAIRALRIPIGEVRANPMYRNQETASYAFGNMVVDSSISLRKLLIAPVPAGTNRAIVVRQGTLSGAMGDHGLRSTEEGDCFVVQRVDSTDFRVLGRLRVQDWPSSR